VMLCGWIVSHRPCAIRWFVISTPYQSPCNFSQVPGSGVLVPQEIRPTVSAKANSSFIILLVLGYPKGTQSLLLQWL
jgi:hypothetical protein